MFRDIPCSNVPGFIDGPVFSKTYGMWFFFTAGDKWYTAKYAKKKWKKNEFFKTLITISRIKKCYCQIITSDRSSHGTARSYSVATFVVKPLQIMKDASARTYSTNYSTTDSRKLSLEDFNRYRCLTNDLSETKTKLKNGLPTDRSD